MLLITNLINLCDKLVVLHLRSQEIDMYAHICEPDNWFHSVICIKLHLSLGNVHFGLIQFPIMIAISYRAIQHPQIFLE